jgi:hypothetical protein
LGCGVCGCDGVLTELADELIGEGEGAPLDGTPAEGAGEPEPPMLGAVGADGAGIEGVGGGGVVTARG